MSLAKLAYEKLAFEPLTMGLLAAGGALTGAVANRKLEPRLQQARYNRWVKSPKYRSGVATGRKQALKGVAGATALAAGAYGLKKLRDKKMQEQEGSY